MNAVEAIRATKYALFTNGWAKGESIAVDGRLCLSGALNLVTMGNADYGSHLYDGPKATLAQYGLRNRCRVAIREVLPGGYERVAPWNDCEERTFTEVIDLLDRAEKWAEVEYGEVN